MRIGDWSSDVCASDLPTFGPEKLTAYEIGAKTDFFDRRLRVNVAAFQSNYNDLQVTTFPGGASSIEPVQVNGGRARIRGVEVEATARPVEAVTATFGLSRLDTKYLEIAPRSEEHTSELQSLMRNSYAVLCLKQQT